MRYAAYLSLTSVDQAVDGAVTEARELEAAAAAARGRGDGALARRIDEEVAEARADLEDILADLWDKVELVSPDRQGCLHEYGGAADRAAAGVKAAALELGAAAAAARGRGDDALARYIDDKIASARANLEGLLTVTADWVDAAGYSAGVAERRRAYLAARRA